LTFQRAFDILVSGSGKVPVGFPVFKIGDRSLCELWWVRPPSIPVIVLNMQGNLPNISLIETSTQSHSMYNCWPTTQPKCGL